MNNQIPKSWIFLFLAVGAVLVGLYLTTPEPQSSTSQESEALEPTRAQTFETMLEVGEDAIYLENQTSGETQVQVGYVILSEPGFVVIYNDQAGIPGEVIGVSQFLQEGGEHLLVRVDELLENAGVYYAALHHDNGDKRFDLARDVLVNDTNDSVVLMTFLAQEDAVPEDGPVMP